MLQLEPDLLVSHVQAVKARLVEALVEHQRQGGALTLDCSALRNADAAGLQLLATLAMALRERGGSLRLHACTPELQGLIAGVALQHLFEFATPEAA